MKRVLIISPYFPPTNAADMQRIRMSLPYFNEFGWECEVVTVDEQFSYLEKDELLLQTVQETVKVHKIPAKNRSTFFGTIAMRSYRSYREAVNNLLKHTHFDLIYFSTTQFQLCALGAYWKTKFGISYVIDMQDPWYTGTYTPGKKSFKYRLVYAQHRLLEKKAMTDVGGLISVSSRYIDDLVESYPQLKNRPSAVIPFGSSVNDIAIAQKNSNSFANLLSGKITNLVYIGRGGPDLYKAIKPLFDVIKSSQKFKQVLRLYFIGTSYAPANQAEASILPLAKEYGLEQIVTEHPQRIGYFHTLYTLHQAHGLFIPGSDDSAYNASKIHPYALSKKPLLAIFNGNSPAIEILKEYGYQNVFSFDKTPDLKERIEHFLNALIDNTYTEQIIDADAVNKYSAESMTRKQCELFDKVLTSTTSN